MHKFKAAIAAVRASGALRMQSWMWLGLATTLAIALISPHQIGVLMAKINLLALAAWAGYWIDRTSSHMRSHEALTLLEQNPNIRTALLYVATELRRAATIAAAMIAMALAL